jgi:membrane associated rhomboid family serine protease
MEQLAIVTIILIIINLLVSYKGFTNSLFFEGYMFKVDSILINKDYIRLISSGFLHLNWIHLLFNMYALYTFGEYLELALGHINFLLIYFISLIGGDLLSLYIHRNHGDYSSVGASGAVCGIIFASIALFPGMGVGFFGLPVYIPGWLFGIVYILFTIYGVRSSTSNVAHEAHLGGALAGMITAIFMQPVALKENYLPITLIFIPSAIFFYMLIKRPEILVIDEIFPKWNKRFTVDDLYNQQKMKKEEKINLILDKIGKTGYASLTDKEKHTLKNYNR